MIAVFHHAYLPGTDNTRNRNVNTSGVRRSITEQVYVGTTQLAWVSQTRHTAVVLHLQVPVWRSLDVVGHGGAHETGRNAVHADTVLAPFHGEGVAHVADYIEDLVSIV